MLYICYFLRSEAGKKAPIAESTRGVGWGDFERKAICYYLFILLGIYFARLRKWWVMSTWNEHHTEFEVVKARNSWLLFTMLEQ
jgi:hypothetical protein